MQHSVSRFRLCGDHFLSVAWVLGVLTLPACGDIIDPPPENGGQLEKRPDGPIASGASSANASSPSSSTPPSKGAGPGTNLCVGGDVQVPLASRSVRFLAVYGGDVYFLDGKGGFYNTDNEYALKKTSFAGGSITTLSQGFDSPEALAVDASGAYVLDGTIIRRVPLAGGPKADVADLGSIFGFGRGAGIALDADAAYVTGGTATASEHHGFAVRVPKDGSALLTYAGNEAVPRHVVVDAQYVYWVNDWSNGITSSNQGDAPLALRRAPKAGGAVVTLAQNQGFLHALPDAMHYGGTYAGAVTADATHVYIASGTDRAIYRYPKAGGAGQTVAIGSETSWPMGIAVTGGDVVWSNGADASTRALYRAPVTGGAPTLVIKTSAVDVAAAASGIAFTTVDGLWADRGLHVLRSCP